MKYVLKIEGMSCKNCVKHVQEAFLETDGVKSCEVSLENKSATVETEKEFSKDTFAQILDDAGYELRGMN